MVLDTLLTPMSLEIKQLGWVKQNTIDFPKERMVLDTLLTPMSLEIKQEWYYSQEGMVLDTLLPHRRSPKAQANKTGRYYFYYFILYPDKMIFPVDKLIYHMEIPLLYEFTSYPPLTLDERIDQ